MHHLRDLVYLSSTRRTLVIEAILCLFAARLALWLLPFRTLARFFGPPPQRPVITGDARAQVREGVRWAVNFVSFRLRIRATCFARAIAAQYMLRRRGIGTTLYYGAATQSGQRLTAHVWLMDGEDGVVGHLRAKDHHVLAHYPETVAAENTLL